VLLWRAISRERDKIASAFLFDVSFNALPATCAGKSLHNFVNYVLAAVEKGEKDSTPSPAVPYVNSFVRAPSQKRSEAT